MICLIAAATVSGAISNESLERKRIMVKLCSGVIEEYTRYAAGELQPKNPVYLEREFQRCAEIVEEYEMLSN